jgi:hypothetical protein
MIKKPRTRTSSRTITIRERRAIRRPVSPGLSPLTSHLSPFVGADPPARFSRSPTRRPADTPTRFPWPLTFDLSPRRPADTPFRQSVSPARRPADPPTRFPWPLTFDLSPRRPAVPPIRRFADPFLPHPLSRLFACFAGPSVFVSPNGTRRSLITLTGASLKWPL